LLEVWGTAYPGAHGLTLSNEGADQFLFITDTDRNQVVKTDLKGRVLLKLDYPRESGVYEYPGQYKPTETAVDPATGDIYIADGYGLNYIRSEERRVGKEWRTGCAAYLSTPRT